MHKELDKGEIFPVLEGKKVLLFVGLGKVDKISLTQLRIDIRKVFLSGYLKQRERLILFPHQDEVSYVTAILEGYLLGTYVWDKYKK